MSDEPAGCKKCGRAVYAKHLDDHGLCSVCRPTRAERAADRAHVAEEKAATDVAAQQVVADQATEPPAWDAPTP